MRRSRSGPSGMSASARSSSGTPASAAARAACASGQRNQRNATLRAMSAASGERACRIRTSRSMSPRACAAGAGSAIHAVSSARTTCTPASYRSRARKMPEHRLLERGSRVQPGDAVVAQRALQRPAELLARPRPGRRPGSAGRRGTARAGCGASRGPAAPRTARRCRRTPSSGPARRAAPARPRQRRVAVGEVVGDQVRRGPLGHVEAQHQAPKPRQRGQGALRRRGLGLRAGSSGRPARPRPRPRGGVTGPGRLQPGQRRAGFDLAADGDQQLAHPRVKRRAQHGLHLHALQHQHRAARAHLARRPRPAWRPPAPGPGRAARRPRRG